MITTLRSILFYCGLIPSTIFFSLTGVLILPLPRKLRYAVILNWARFGSFWLRVTCGLSWRVTGRENIPAGPCVIMSKHQSAWETMVLQLIFPPQCQVVKRELLRVPIFGMGLASLNPIAIDRSAGTRALKTVLAEGKKRIADGWCVLLFPEGTRVPAGQSGRYTQTGAALARDAGCPLVPVAHNAGVFWPKNALRKEPGVVDVVIGAPIQPDGRSTAELTREIETWIEATSRQILPPGFVAPAAKGTPE